MAEMLPSLRHKMLGGRAIYHFGDKVPAGAVVPASRPHCSIYSPGPGRVWLPLSNGDRDVDVAGRRRRLGGHLTDNEDHMRGKRTSIIVASVLVFGSVGTATARDLCVDMGPGFGVSVVGKDFTIPASDKCKPFTGFIGATTLVSGTGYTSANGNFFRRAFTAHAAAPFAFNPITVVCSIP